MPIYEYRCGACGHQEDHLQKVTERPLSKCPACGKKSYKKLLSAAGFQLKGSGWYATDFKPAAKAASPKPEGEAKSEAKGEPKAEAKKDKKNSKTEAAA
jgi:putative FmdB family regulatory protein